MAPITINGNTLDPDADRATLRSLHVDVDDASKSAYILIQASAPMSSDEKLEIEAVGAKILEYVSDATYLCRYDPYDISAITSKPFVAWVNPYPNAFVVPPELKAEPGPEAHGLMALAPALATGTERPVYVCLHNDIDASAPGLKAAVAQAAHVTEDAVEEAGNKFRVVTEEQHLDALAAIDQVYFLEEVKPVGLFNNKAVDIVVARQLSLLTSEPFRQLLFIEGEGEVVAVGDTGFDIGSTKYVHSAFEGRVKALYPTGRPQTKLADDPDGHGTHVCGSVLGKEAVQFADGTWDQMVGTAPRAHLVVQSLYSGMDEKGHAKLNPPSNLLPFFQIPYIRDGARVHTNSWGTTAVGAGYDASAREIDSFVHSHPDMVILFAAGNSGRDGNKDGVVDLGQIGSQAFAKNCITVGATESWRDFDITYGSLWPTDFPADPIKSDRIANGAFRGMAAFSSRGPAPAGPGRDARIKPDLVAPGTCILSAKSRGLSPKSATNETIANGVFGVSPHENYWYAAGTSMATPLVAGCCAALREYLRRNKSNGQLETHIQPSAALVKAILINGASKVTGQYTPSEAGTSPNPNSGWGCVDLRTSVQVANPGYPYAHFWEGDALKEGQSYTKQIDIPDWDAFHSSGIWKPRMSTDTLRFNLRLRPTLKITLVWTDPPSPRNPSNANILQNILEFAVRFENGGEERHGNRKPGDLSYDRTNNVQQVMWERVPAGKLEVVVRARHFATPQSTQKFALAWALFVDDQDSD